MALGIWSRFQSLIFGGAIGAAASEAIAPALEPARQHAWQQNQVRVLDPNTLAHLVAEGAITLAAGQQVAARNGYSADSFNGYVQLALHGPGLGEALRAYQRYGNPDVGPGITQDQLHHAYAKAGIEQQYWPAIDALAVQPLDPNVIANAIVRDVIAAPFPLPYAPPASGGNVPTFPKSPLSAEAEAAASGVNVDRLFVLTAIAGRPMAPEEAAKAQFRGILQAGDYERAILEGDIRGEWGDAIREYTREILTAHDHVELRLRGWYTSDADMYAGTALHGMSVEDTDRLFKVLGRPISFRNVFLGERRGGVYDGPTGAIEPPILKSLQESNLRPEWYNLANALVETKPTLFFVRTWLKDGHDPAQAQTWLYELGYSNADIQAIITAYTGGPATTSDPHVKSATTTTLTALKKAYVAGTYDGTATAAFLTDLGITGAAQTNLLGVWAILKLIEGGTAPAPPP